MRVFVFGANLQGIHGAGAAKYAMQHHGAVWGKYGRQGASYGIPTKATPYRRLPLSAIQAHVSEFLRHAEANPDDTFETTPIGCGLAGFTPREIAPLFGPLWLLPGNVVLPLVFTEVLATW